MPRTYAEVVLTNPGTSSTVAFAVQLQLEFLSSAARDGVTAAPHGPDVWEDNYVTLLPGEKRTVGVSYAAGAGTPRVNWRAYNNIAQAAR